jgi:hypothetical protein
MHAHTRWNPILGFVFVMGLLQPAMAMSESPAFVLSETEIVTRAGGNPFGPWNPLVSSANDREPDQPDPTPGIHSGTDSQPTDKKGTSPAAPPDEAQAMKERIIDLQNKGKLGFRKIVACSTVEGFGVYSPIEPGQTVGKVVFYCEPANVSTLRSQDRYIVDCAVDFLLMDSSGKVLGGKENALKINRISRSPVMDLYFKVEMRLRKLADRSVFIKTVLHDKIKNETVSVINRINVDPGVKKNDGI